MCSSPSQLQAEACRNKLFLARLQVSAAPSTERAADFQLKTRVCVAEAARDYLELPCALIKGALVHLGVECSVTADPSALPACDFTITIKNR